MIRLADQPASPNFTATRNACKLCTPLGACLAFAGIEGAVPLLHGSQGCATYIRRYMISHFREPMDIASSNFGEHAAIFGGAENLHAALANVIAGYSPSMIGLATTCLAETIGDDVRLFLRAFAEKQHGRTIPPIVSVSTPSYAGTHAEGYFAALRATVDQLAQGVPWGREGVNIIPGMVSPADLRHLRELVAAFGIQATILPDYADRLDGGIWTDYQRIPDGGTRLGDIRRMGQARATIEMASPAAPADTAGTLLETRHRVANLRIAMPIGVRLSDRLFDGLAELGGGQVPDRYVQQRARLIDAYVDAHKYVAGRRAIVYGEAELVVGLVAMLAEVGIRPVLAATGGNGGRLADAIAQHAPETLDHCRIEPDVDFEQIGELAASLAPDLILGHSKGYGVARQLGVPLVRVGFPIHDRFGGARVQHIGYAGTQQLFDRIVNALLERQQGESEIGFTYQ